MAEADLDKERENNPATTAEMAPKRREIALNGYVYTLKKQ
jgi:hypothetical protein